MKKFLLASALAVLAWAVASPSPAEAVDFTPTGSVLSVTYKEPTTNTDGSLMNDGKETQIFFRLCPTSGPCTAAFSPGTITPMAAPTGGANISASQTVPIAPGQENNVEVYVLARDTSNNASPESTHVTKRVDRLSPSAPQ